MGAEARSVELGVTLPEAGGPPGTCISIRQRLRGICRQPPAERLTRHWLQTTLAIEGGNDLGVSLDQALVLSEEVGPPQTIRGISNMTQKSKTLSEVISPLKPFVERTAVMQSPTKNIFLSCLKASFVSTFEFVDMASKEEIGSAFFLTPALRRPTEDIIYFRFLSRHPRKVREKILMDMMALEVMRNLKHQDSFFSKFRPYQPVIKEQETDIDKIEESVRSFWRNNGWPNLNNRVSPPIEQIARKSDPELLDIVYNFIYRLTSGTVHFNPQILLRSGWGDRLMKKMKVSPRNMDPYYVSVNQVYGSLLLCLYFEFFGRFLRPQQEEKMMVKELRECLQNIFRWPEMVTFEEMNIDVPKPTIWPTTLIHLMYSDIITENGFISGAKKLRNMNRKEIKTKNKLKS